MRFHVLGPLEVVTGAGPVPIRGRRLRALVAVLLLHSNQIVPIDRIIDGLWPGEPPRSAVENIRTYVSQLRSLLSEVDDPARLESHPGGYRLVAEPEEVDLLRFATLASEGSRAQQHGFHASAAVLLGEALALWRASPLPELELGVAVRAKALALEEQRWRVQVDWVSARLALGEHAEALPTLRELVGERPLDERVWSRLVTALYATGRTAEALAAFAEARRTLVDELGIEPGPELRRLQAAVLAGERLPGVGGLAPGGPGSDGLGVRRPAPGAGGPDAAGPGPAGGVVGRVAELRAFRALLDAGEEPPARLTLVLVTGPPGVGKSALALALASAARGAFPDGPVRADLRASSGEPVDAAEALAAPLAAFGVEPGAQPQGLEGRRALYRALLAGRKAVVVLDDVAEEGGLRSLLPGPGPCLVLVTSRRRLPVDADLHLDLAPLDGDDALALLRATAGAERVDREPAAAAAVVEALGGLPAAVQAAGARLLQRPGRPVAELARRLGAPAGLLDELGAGGWRLRETLDTCYRALEPEARQCFEALGLLPPEGVTAGGLAALLGTGGPAAGRALERLAAEGLLGPDGCRHGAAAYRVPRVVHAYARARRACGGTGSVLAPGAGGRWELDGGKARSEAVSSR